MRQLIAPRNQLLEFNAQFAPLDFGNAQVLTDFIIFNAAFVFADGVGPAAHVERQVLVERSVIADVF